MPHHRCQVRRVGVVVQVRHQPAFHVGPAHSLAGGVVDSLVALYFGEAEMFGVGVSEIPAADRRRRQHGEAFGQGNDDDFGGGHIVRVGFVVHPQ